MRTRPLRMRRITWPVSRGSKQLHIWNPRPWFAYSLYNFYWATTTINGRLLSSPLVLKPFSGEKKSRRNGAQKWRFLGKMGRSLRLCFRDPKRHFLARNRVVWRILRQNRCTRLGCSISQGSKNSRVTLLPRGAKSRMRRTETPEPIWIKFCLVVDVPDVVTYTNFGDHRLRGFGERWLNFPLSRRL